MHNVVIRGDGVASYCCAHLLAKAGFRVILKPVERPRLPVIMLGDHALALLRDVFDQPDLFSDLPRIERRVVAWGAGAKPATLDHSAVVVSEDLLLNSLRPFEINEEFSETDTDWAILASKPLPAPALEYRFGSRMATPVPIELCPNADSSACLIESLENGWLFLIPNAPKSGWLLSVGDPFETLLESSRVIANSVSRFLPAAGEFPSFPRIVSPLSGTGWLACGTAAMAFDPICGDGTAHAVREAILASAVIRALAKNATPAELLAHYEGRLTAGFRRHLSHCREYYASGGTSVWWNAELQAIRHGIDWCDGKLRAHATFQYQLRGFELEPVR